MKNLKRVGIAAAFAVMVLAANASHAGSIVTFDFTEDDSGNALVNGQAISTAPDRQDALGNPDSFFEFGTLANVSTTGTNHNGAAIFDSNSPGPNTSGADPDLIVNLGNILILQNDALATSGTTDTGAGSNGLVFNTPNDEANPNDGSIVFDFLQTVEALSVDLVDANGGFDMEIVLTDTLGHSRTYTIPQHWSNQAPTPVGYDTLSFLETAPQLGEGGSFATQVTDVDYDPTQVVSIEFIFGSSGGIDNLVVGGVEEQMIPEPSTVAIMLLSLAALAPFARKRR